ncbi:Uncharacterized protein OS=Isosphaera pallida (strain ATCC 43644 / DSM 9630 / IS1B) GN=Isop_3569 PE=4 SV=1 [Gemmata massiliana]|uniref:Uncharacterized protein n=1 Tax=Gemmata massiliana TaxID=1210884 RepID=A0A6P2D1G9_9BACT|nr:hypothetical protein [Gemmata massiliana]VTR95178.1 Uncharacterized protein OS=Isosphaera pallida (strain ATCC 43644 / DSM 9630 / IS1B) GN=Isop_3569 PE=4 SV=1 [Gemmata massiliana]
MRGGCSTDLFRTGALVLAFALAPFGGFASAQNETTVGMTGTLEGVVLPGSELEAAPLTDRKARAVVRVARVYPHGTAFRYDLEYFGLEPGAHDLCPYLKRKDGSPLGELPPITVQVSQVLPPGQVQPNKLEIDTGSRFGGYRFLVIGAVAVWVLGLIAVVASFFFPRRKRAGGGTDRKPVSLAERLRPLVEGATAGTLSHSQLADLERALLAYWRKRLALEGAEPGEAIEVLRKHPDAGPLLAQLEAWLHRPGPPQSVDVAALLAPYRDLPPDALELEVGSAA